MRGYDHHCTLLNNCVGKRTLRVFIFLLITTTIFYLTSGIVAAIAILYEPYINEWNKKGSFDFSFDLIMMMVIVVLQIVKFVLLCCLK